MNCVGKRCFLFMLFFVFILLGFGFGAYYINNQIKGFKEKVTRVEEEIAKQVGAVTVLPKIVSSEGIPETTWIDVQQKVKNTVVKIIVDHAQFNWLEPYKAPEVGSGSGSGFFINNDGDIVTNYHVVNQPRLIQIEIPALGAERLEVTVVGVSPERDIALLRLTDRSKEKIKRVSGGAISFLKLGDSDAVRRGQAVLALGYPLAVQALKSTQGIVSGRERLSIIKQSCIQTTAPLNPGNSGGPAINSAGEVVGINFAMSPLAQNVGYIIPINDVKSALKDMYKIKLLRRPVLGCLLEPANSAMLTFLGNPKPGGYYIAKIFKNMMLEKVGLQAGDMIYEVNGFQIDRYGRATVPWDEDKVSMVDILDRLEVGDKIDMVVYRKGERKTFEFTLEPRFLQPIRYIYPDYEDVDYEVIGGMVIMELRQNHIPFLAEGAHGLLSYESSEKQYEPALVVSYVQPTSLVSKLRLLFPGYILSDVNGESVSTLEQFRKAVIKSKESRYLTVRTSDDMFVVLSVDEILADEDRLSKVYQFKKSPLLDAIA